VTDEHRAESTGDRPRSTTERTPGHPTGVSPAIEVTEVAVSYGEESVLQGISASVDAGELVGLVGPNGAGKTTLLRAISGALDPDRGTVRVQGQAVSALSSAAASRRIAVVPQEPKLGFSFTVADLVEMGRHPHRSRFQAPTQSDREHVRRAMERTRTAQFADRTIDDVSGGERQRVLLARALAQDAPVLLLDEPTASLDLNHAVETMGLVRDLVAEEGVAGLAAIHDLELAARFCDRLLVLSDGEIVTDGPPSTVLAADRLADAFDARIAVESAPIDGGRTVRALDEPAIDTRVHVVGGGEAAAGAIGRLGEAGADLSLGPVPEGDRAVSTAEAFDAAVVAVPRFCAVDAGAIERARTLADEAEVVVLAAERVGPDAPAWRESARAAQRLVVLDGTDVGREAEDPEDDATSADRLATAPRVGREALPDVVAALASGPGTTPEETARADRRREATLADGGEGAEDHRGMGSDADGGHPSGADAIGEAGDD